MLEFLAFYVIQTKVKKTDPRHLIPSKLNHKLLVIGLMPKQISEMLQELSGKVKNQDQVL